MLQTFTQILPLELGQIFSPGILAIILLLLGSQIHPRARSLSFFAGSLAVALLIAYFGIHLGANTPEDHQTQISAIIDLVLAGVLIFVGLQGLFSKEKKFNVKPNQKIGYLKWFLAGLIISITNFDAVLLNLSAAKIIGADLHTHLSEKIVLAASNIFFFLFVIIIPMLFYLIVPQTAQKLLAPLSGFVQKYSKYIVAVILIAMAVYFLVHGIKFFV